MKVLLLSGVVLVGCGVGGDDNPGPDVNPNGLRCTAAFTTTGTFNEGQPRPLVNKPGDPRDGLPIQGCWPAGMWTFTAAIDNAAEVVDITGDGVGDRCGDAGTSAPALEASYSFRVEKLDDPNGEGLIDKYTYLGSSPDFFRVRVSEGGSGDCEGIMEMISADKTQLWTFNPSICTSDATRTIPPEEPLCTAYGPNLDGILGTGDFNEYLEPQAL